MKEHHRALSAGRRNERPLRRSFLPAGTVLLAVALLAGCAVGPRYQRPSVPPLPAAWKSEAPWRLAEPKDGIPKGEWWALFNDADLDRYERQALAADQTLEAARLRVEEARAFARVVSSGFFPQFDVFPSVSRQRISANRPLVNPPSHAITQDAFVIPFAISYEPDVFGQTKRSLESANASLQATVANLENVRLIVTSELAADYFTLRELDAEIGVIQESIGYQQKGLDLVRRREAGGLASGLEVAQQESVLNATRAQLDLLSRERAQYEHAIAVLIGAPAPSTAVPAGTLTARSPEIPLGVPTDVLERRPDVASAERVMAAANAEIGIVKAAFFPSILLSFAGGSSTRSISTLLDAPSMFWAMGLSAAQTIFDGGRRHAQFDLAKIGYDETVANYRQSVLVALQQVEDTVSALDALARAAQNQDQAVAASLRSLQLANNRYVGGLVSYLDVITAQEAVLSNQRLATQLAGERLVTSVFLVKALGGGWDASSLAAISVKPEARQAFRQ